MNSLALMVSVTAYWGAMAANHTVSHMLCHAKSVPDASSVDAHHTVCLVNVCHNAVCICLTNPATLPGNTDACSLAAS
jgi:hypothetical protein